MMSDLAKACGEKQRYALDGGVVESWPFQEAQDLRIQRHVGNIFQITVRILDVITLLATNVLRINFCVPQKV
jgi:hypothetical protein